MDIFLLYLWTRLDTINLFLILGTFILGITVFMLFGAKLYSSESDRETEEYEQVMRMYKPIKYAFFTFMVLVMAIPTQKDVTIIAGGWLAKEIITNPKTKEIGGKVYQLVNKKLDEQLKEVK